MKLGVMFNKFMVSMVLLATVFFSCDKNETADSLEFNHEIGFKSDGATPITRSFSQLPEGASFGVLAYSCSTGIFDPINSLPDLLYNARVEKYISEDSVGYKYFPSAHWPSESSTKVQFGAYYPHNSTVADGAISVTPFTSVGLPKITLVMGLEKGSLDFSTSVVGPISRLATGDPAGTPTRANNYVNFHFKRRMAYVSFRCKSVNAPNSNTKLYIYKITLRNIYRRATFDLADNTWKDQGIDATTGATLNLQSTGAPVSDTDFKDIIDPSNPSGTMYSVIPQNYQGVELSVLYAVEYLNPDGGCEHRIVGNKSVPISVNWIEGHQHIYDLEFAFDEIYGDEALLALKVLPWKVININTTM